MSNLEAVSNFLLNSSSCIPHIIFATSCCCKHSLCNTASPANFFNDSLNLSNDSPLSCLRSQNETRAMANFVLVFRILVLVDQYSVDDLLYRQVFIFINADCTFQMVFHTITYTASENCLLCLLGESFEASKVLRNLLKFLSSF